VSTEERETRWRMAREIAKANEPQRIEPRWAEFWVKEALFKADPDAPGPVFSMVIPPPNVTGSLHIGHMLNHTEIDILTRWHRMRGYNTLYLPGMDHAGISTQRVVVRQLAAQGIDYRKLGREEFERRVWKWKEESGGTILQQMRQIGDSCDWSREKFTLSPELSKVVREVFVRLYKEGLIYRATRLVNWCPDCLTVLSDLEVVHEERQGNLWYIKYPIVGTKEFLTVATTRPETMLGDTAVAVHPADERYQHLVGKQALLPLVNREIPIIADEMVNREFGTGAVKVTPAHDPNDFELGKRHQLAEIDVMTDDARMSAKAGAYAGMDRFAARKKIVEDLKAQGLLDKITDHTNAIGLCERSKTVVEPRISTQWFCKMKDLAAPAIKAVEEYEPGKENGIYVVPAHRVSQLDAQHPRLDPLAAALVGAPHSRVVLQGKPAHHGGARNSNKVPNVRVGQPGTGSRRSGHLVQLGAVAVLNDGLARKDGGLQEVLSDKPANHRIRHPVFLGGADDHDGPSFYG